jgi:P-type conjugative transfer protein TrbJ
MALERPMTRTSRRLGLTATLAAAWLAMAGAWASPARADLWGGDLPLLAGILAEAFSEVSNLSSMVEQVVEQVRLMRTMISGLDASSFAALTELLREAETTHDTLTAGIRSMSYSLGRIDSEFRELFPSDPHAATFDEHAAYYSRWNQEVLAAAQIASRQQTVIGKLGDSAAKAREIAQQSQNAPGEVAQLQLIVQMLSILHTQLLTLNQTLATTGRVLTDIGAGSASASQLSQAKRQTSLSNYTSRGDPVRVPSRMP